MQRSDKMDYPEHGKELKEDECKGFLGTRAATRLGLPGPEDGRTRFRLHSGDRNLPYRSIQVEKKSEMKLDPFCPVPCV
jgi:hypothetical protein